MNREQFETQWKEIENPFKIIFLNNNCGTRVMPGSVYIKISGLNYCTLCDGPGKKAWEKLK